MFYSVATTEKLAELRAHPPAIAYVHETGMYYLRHNEPWFLQNTPYYAGLAGGWQPLDSACPLHDRKIHYVNTRWVNGQDLDYYPDFILPGQGGGNEGWEDLEEVQGEVFGPPSGDYNTTLGDLEPSDLILRYQVWDGTTTAEVTKGDTVIPVTGITGEIADKYGTAYAAETASNTVGQSGAYMIFAVGGWHEVINHFPNAYAQPDQYGNNKSPWRPNGLPTTSVILTAPIEGTIPAGTAFRITCAHWYIASVEQLVSCAEHRKHCWPIYRIAGADAPGRFKRQCHSVGTDNMFAALQDQKRLVPGDFIYNENRQTWAVAIPELAGLGANLAPANMGRVLTVANRAQFNYLREHFLFNEMFVLNRQHETQGYRPTTILSVEEDFTFRVRPSRYVWKPADWIYVEGNT